MILALYSDQVIAENAPMDRRLAEIARQRGEHIGYISSGPDPDRSFFREKAAYYAEHGLTLDPFIDLDAVVPEDLERLFSCNAIHLSGGHTGHFLQRLHNANVFERLRSWALDDGILIGTSAGAILMTPTIAVDAFFLGQQPSDIIDGEALDLVPFEYFPHLNEDESFLPKLLRYSEMISHPVVACRDGEGLIVHSDGVEIFGKPLMIFQGSADVISLERLDALMVAARRLEM
ncbi:Type 1 glutamine amidotransferase-like domain-containing protein [Rhizobium sp. Rhizsp82]|uniref:Type 1 glutamine amidotransferase-like domain-containing protein n=1 Tax=Rhizobium sp. Rhizsp82 TaxID=3243057 RepID=UPI0039B3BE31